MTAPRTPDLLDELDTTAAASFLTAGEVREAWLTAARDIAHEGDGTFDAGRIRTRIPDWAHGPESGAAITGMVRRGEAAWTGRMATLGNTAHRAGARLVKVYRLVEVAK